MGRGGGRSPNSSRTCDAPKPRSGLGGIARTTCRHSIALCWKRVPRVGLPELADLNDLDATAGIAPAPVNAVGAVRWNTALAYLDDARTRPNLTIIDETLSTASRSRIGPGSRRRLNSADD